MIKHYYKLNSILDFNRHGVLMKENDIYTISRINNLIDKKISYCDDFRKIKIRGEITNFNGSYNSGHYYFSLKDKKIFNFLCNV